MPDLHTPLPDGAHEALRQAVLTAIDDLTTQVQRIDDAYLLLLGTVGFAQATLNTTVAGQAEMAKLGKTNAGVKQQLAAINTRLDADAIRDKTTADCIDDLQRRIAALEQQAQHTVDVGVQLPEPEASDGQA